MTTRWRIGITVLVLAIAAIDVVTGDYRSAVILTVMAGLIFVAAGVNAALERWAGPAVQVGWGAVFFAAVAVLMWAIVLSTNQVGILGVTAALGATAMTLAFAWMTLKVARNPDAAEKIEQARAQRGR